MSSSPKKEKKDPLAAVATEEAKAQEEATPAVAAEVEEVKIEEAKAGLVRRRLSVPSRYSTDMSDS